MKQIHIIVAITKNNAIGKNGKLLYNIKNDLKRFKELTINNIVIMGRNTFESIGRLLPNRENIIISSKNLIFDNTNGHCVNSVESALELANNLSGDKIFIIGGGKLYKDTINIADILDITEIDSIVEDADTYFPEIPDNFKLLGTISWITDKDTGIKYRYVTYRNIKRY